MSDPSRTGPLSGLRVVEIAGIGPGPFAAMLLADMGADVVCVTRRGAPPPAATDVLQRGKTAVALDLKDDADRVTLLRLVSAADILVEGFRPGVMERNGVGPDVCAEVNPRLVYGRMTGWGQDGPLARTAGHDISYISVSGVLHNFARAGDLPVPPLNTVGDFGGGAMFLVVGVLAAYVEAQRSGRGQVVDAAMVDGSALLLAQILGFHAAGRWTDVPGTNLVDTGAPFYDVYRTADGKLLSVGAIEPQFYRELLARAGLADADLPEQRSQADWPVLKRRLAEVFASRTLQEWLEVYDGTDACVAPVLSMTEARHHPHLRSRETYVTVEGVLQPAPAPRFSRTRSRPRPVATEVEPADAVLARWDARVPAPTA